MATPARSTSGILGPGGGEVLGSGRRLTGAGPVNVGQIYTTLDRLQRDGLVERGDPDADGKVVYRITEQGQKAAVEWLLDPSGVPTTGRSEVAGKVLLALHVPDVDPQQVIDTHRLAFLASVQQHPATSAGEALELEERLLVEAEVAVTEAELHWLDLVRGRATRPRKEVMTVLIMRNVSHTFEVGPDRVVALADVNLSVEAGEFVAVMGPSGSGKSTLVNVAAGLVKPFSGQVVISGVEVTSAPPGCAPNCDGTVVGVVHQTDELDPVLTAVENVEPSLVARRCSQVTST